MILQNLLRPSPERCTEKELYCREENGQLIFNTWFNLFSVGKWLEYTEIRQFSLKLRAAGSFEVKLFDRNGELSGRTCCFAEETELTIPMERRQLLQLVFLSADGCPGLALRRRLCHG